MAELKLHILSHWFGSMKLFSSFYFPWLPPLKALGFPYMSVILTLITDSWSSYDISVLLYTILPPSWRTVFTSLPFWEPLTLHTVRLYVLLLFLLPKQYILKLRSSEKIFKNKFYPVKFLSPISACFWSLSLSAFKYLFL